MLNIGKIVHHKLTFLLMISYFFQSYHWCWHIFLLFQEVRSLYLDKQVLISLIRHLQGCGSAFILCWSGSGSSSFTKCGSGSGSRSRSSLTKFEENKSWRVFLRNNGACANLLLKKLNNVAVISNFLAFVSF